MWSSSHIRIGTSNIASSRVRRMSLRVFAFAVVAIASLASSTVSALAPEKEAELLAQSALDQAKQGNYSEAAEIYERAFALAKARKYAWNAARTHELAGSLPRAYTWYRLSATVTIDVEGKAKVAEALGRLDGLFMRQGYGKVVALVTPRDAKVEIDGIVIDVIGGSRLLWLPAGVHHIAAMASGFETFTAPFAVAAAQELRIERVLNRSARVERDDHAQPEPHDRSATSTGTHGKAAVESGATWRGPAGIAALSVGAAVVIVGAVLAVTGGAGEHAANQLPTAKAAEVDAYEQAFTSARSKLNLGRGLVAAGAVVAGVGAWMWLTKPQPRPATAAGLSPNAGGVTVWMCARF